MSNKSQDLRWPEVRIAVVIPAYKVSLQILSVVDSIPTTVWRIYVVDDCCPNESGKLVENNTLNDKVRVLFNKKNQGVGGAVLTGYSAAIADGADIIVKIDGDGQMDASLIPLFVEPIIAGDADYTKGNRFFDLEQIREMPTIRIFGNAVLSLMTKLSAGYWNLFDPTNGYTAIHADVAKNLAFDKISHRYFFESDMLFRLNLLRAVVFDIPMDAKYGDEVSNLKISKILFDFLFKHSRNFLKRIFYNYYLRDLSLASIELPLGILLLSFGIVFGCIEWLSSAKAGVPTPAGTVMLAAMPLLMGLQLLLAFIGYDITTVPSRVRHQRKRKVDQ